MMSPHTSCSAAAPVHPSHLAESPGQSTSSDHPGETERLVHTWLRDSVHVIPDRGGHPSCSFLNSMFCFQAILVGNEDASQCLNPIPNNVIHRAVLPIQLNYYSSLLPKTEVFSRNIVKVFRSQSWYQRTLIFFIYVGAN